MANYLTGAERYNRKQAKIFGQFKAWRDRQATDNPAWYEHHTQHLMSAIRRLTHMCAKWHSVVAVTGLWLVVNPIGFVLLHLHNPVKVVLESSALRKSAGRLVIANSRFNLVRRHEHLARIGFYNVLKAVVVGADNKYLDRRLGFLSDLKGIARYPTIREPHNGLFKIVWRSSQNRSCEAGNNRLPDLNTRWKRCTAQCDCDGHIPCSYLADIFSANQYLSRIRQTRANVYYGGFSSYQLLSQGGGLLRDLASLRPDFTVGLLQCNPLFLGIASVVGSSSESASGERSEYHLYPKHLPVMCIVLLGVACIFFDAYGLYNAYRWWGGPLALLGWCGIAYSVFMLLDALG